MKVFIVGVGYVGLVTAACLAELGHEVCGADIDAEKIKKLKGGRCPIYEPGLEEIIKRNTKAGRLKLQVGVDGNINKYDMAMIAVGTPERISDGRADLFYVGETARQIAQNCRKKDFVVVGKSTVPIGTAAQIRQSLSTYNSRNTKFHVGSNPETLREGNATADFMNPDRIIIGGDKKARDALLKLYEEIDCPKIVTNARSAEMVKLASNFMLALRVSATNILSRICDMTGADIEKVMEGVGMDKRIGSQFLRAGIGYGGSCFPKDTKSIRSIADHYRLDTSIFDAVIGINKDQREWFCKKVDKITLFTLKNKKIAVWGLAFKPDTDDTREAPAIDVIKWLLKEGAVVSVYDPVANVKKIFGKKVRHCRDMYEAVEKTEALLIVTEWNEFQKADLKKVKKKMMAAKIVDGRNMYEPKKMKRLGFEYVSMGRP
jgi:UDPglucose 6-dehydrogenase